MLVESKEELAAQASYRLPQTASFFAQTASPTHSQLLGGKYSKAQLSALQGALSIQD